MWVTSSSRGDGSPWLWNHLWFDLVTAQSNQGRHSSKWSLRPHRISVLHLNHQQVLKIQPVWKLSQLFLLSIPSVPASCESTLNVTCVNKPLSEPAHPHPQLFPTRLRSELSRKRSPLYQGLPQTPQSPPIKASVSQLTL